MEGVFMSPLSITIFNSIFFPHPKFQELPPINYLLSWIFPIVHPNSNVFIFLSHLLPSVLSTYSTPWFAQIQFIPAVTRKLLNHYWFHCHEKYILHIRIQSWPSLCIPSASGHLLMSSLHSTSLFHPLHGMWEVYFPSIHLPRLLCPDRSPSPTLQVH